MDTVLVASTPFTNVIKSNTSTWNDWLAEAVPSETLTVMVWVEGAWLRTGFQRTSPVADTVKLVGPFTNRYVRVLAGSSESVAERVTCNGLPWTIAWLATAASTGALLASVTVTEKVRSAVKPSGSLTRTVTGWVSGPCASVGVQRITPVAASTDSPEGPDTKA